eukprot:GEMP01069972.1.p2 GENE.GEMP01069972.1~~GEMP01069972.1.p2  ORF type:complete len:146 (+),score=25.57 GEMP01069972.1:615-1052(+)
MDMPNARQIYADVGIPGYLHLPVSDYNPISMEHIEMGIKFVEAQRRLGRATLVYCGYGDGRTGSFVAAYEALLMIRDNQGLSLAQVERYVRTRNQVTKPKMPEYESSHKIENDMQLHRVLEFAQWQYAKSQKDLYFGFELEDMCV